MNNLVPRLTVNFKSHNNLHIDGNFSNFSVYFSNKMQGIVSKFIYKHAIKSSLKFNFPECTVSHTSVCQMHKC